MAREPVGFEVEPAFAWAVYSTAVVRGSLLDEGLRLLRGAA